MGNLKKPQGNSISSEQSSNVESGSEKESLRDKLGGVIEKVGHKISEAGAPGLGQAIHDLGDKLEESHKNPSHPHDV